MRGSFENILAKLEERKELIIEGCHRNFDALIEDNNKHIENLKNNLDVLHLHLQKIVGLQKDSENFDYITKWVEIKRDFTLNKLSNTKYEPDSRIRFPSSTIFQDFDTLLG